MRKMASIQKVREILPHNNADALEIAMINDWQVVVKKGEFKKDELVVYFEVDSWVPSELAPFLSKGKEPREYEGVKGERLKTVKLRGEVGQGLILPLNTDILFRIESWVTFNIGLNNQLFEGMDVTEALNVKKWEPVLATCIRGLARGNFPAEIPKTDQERIQNLSKYWDGIKDKTWEVTEKLHGSSCTFYLDSEDIFHVCSRNLDLKYDENNAYWKIAKMYNVENVMRSNNLNGYAIQGELIGEGVNGNQYGVKGLDFYVFDIYNSNSKKYLAPKDRVNLTESINLKHVPVISHSEKIQSETIKDLLSLVEKQKSNLNSTNIEGWVFKVYDEGNLDTRDVKSFKVISNAWLLKNE